MSDDGAVKRYRTDFPVAVNIKKKKEMETGLAEKTETDT